MTTTQNKTAKNIQVGDIIALRHPRVAYDLYHPCGDTTPGIGYLPYTGVEMIALQASAARKVQIAATTEVVSNETVELESGLKVAMITCANGMKVMMHKDNSRYVTVAG
jgi:hypothetical protein